MGHVASHHIMMGSRWGDGASSLGDGMTVTAVASRGKYFLPFVWVCVLWFLFMPALSGHLVSLQHTQKNVVGRHSRTRLGRAPERDRRDEGRPEEGEVI